MALIRNSRLEKCLIVFDDDGRYVSAEALFEVGAWDTVLEEWVGAPLKEEVTLHTSVAAGAKQLNDILGTATLKALIAANEANERADKFHKDNEALLASFKAADTDKTAWKLSAESAYARHASLLNRYKERVAQYDSVATAYKELCSFLKGLTLGLWKPRLTL